MQGFADKVLLLHFFEKKAKHLERQLSELGYDVESLVVSKHNVLEVSFRPDIAIFDLSVVDLRITRVCKELQLISGFDALPIICLAKSVKCIQGDIFDFGFSQFLNLNTKKEELHLNIQFEIRKARALQQSRSNQDALRLKLNISQNEQEDIAQQLRLTSDKEHRLMAKLKTNQATMQALQELSFDSFLQWHIERDSMDLIGNVGKRLENDHVITGVMENFWLPKLHPVDREKISAAISEFKKGSRFSLEQECRMLDQNGSYFWLSLKMDIRYDGSERVIYGILRDIDSNKQQDKKLFELERFDALTGLPNRTWLKQHFGNLKAINDDVEYHHALLFIDIDNFKNINETLGHKIGDELLKLTAFRIQSALDDSDILVRFGGDEFVLLLEEIVGPHIAVEKAVAILKAFEQSIPCEELELSMSPSIGIAICPDQGADLDELLQNADTAVSHVKKNGRNNFQFYNKVMQQQLQVRVKLENDIRKALEKHEFNVYYQAKIELSSEKLIGMEALVRWESPERGLVLPNDFIPVAEESGLIEQIGEYVLARACRDTKQWVEQGLFSGRVAVNISAKQFKQRDLIDKVDKILNATQLDPGHLEFEITEGAIMGDSEASMAALHRLRRRNIDLTIDDFGTGYSSLSYLKNYPVNCVKLDISFIRDISISENGRNIVKAIINMAHLLNLNVVAEGVESEEQLSILRSMECDIMQGYLFSLPLSSSDFEKLLNQEQPVLRTG